jgi:hypothetical protein
MILTLELTSEEEKRLAVQARVRGVDMATLVRGLLDYLPEEEEEIVGDGKPSLDDLEAMFVELAEGHETRPVLVPEATTRALLAIMGKPV